MLCLVGGLSGVATLHEPGSLAFEDAVPRERFEPAISEAEARAIARETLFRAVLYGRKRSGIPFDEPVDTALVHYPYWVYYYRRRNRIDIRLLDAVTGQRPGHKIKLGIVEAFQHSSAGEEGNRGKTGD